VRDRWHCRWCGKAEVVPSLVAEHERECVAAVAGVLWLRAGGTGRPACAPQDLSVSWVRQTHPSMPGVVYFLRLRNTTGSSCLIKGYPRLRVVGPASLRGNRAVYAPGNAALGKIPVSEVELAPGQAVLSQVLLGGLGGPDCASPVWRVTAPSAPGQRATRLTMPKATGALLCSNTSYEVSPVYPASRRRGLAPRSRHSTPATGRRHFAYRQAAATVRAYLATWKDQGLRAANDRFLLAPPEPGSAGVGPDLLSGRLVAVRPVSWTSPARFTVAVQLELRFRGRSRAWAAWGDGTNTRFVTFTRSLGSHTGYRITLATGR